MRRRWPRLSNSRTSTSRLRKAHWRARCTTRLAVFSSARLWISGGLPIKRGSRIRRKRNCQQHKDTAIDMARELVENLHPTLLDNIGLYPTLRWHLKARCTAAAVPYTDSFPASEEPMAPEVRIGVFRILEEALKNLFSQSTPNSLSLRVEIIDEILHCHLNHETGDGCCGAAHSACPETSMHLRAKSIGGTLRWNRAKAEQHLHVQVPLPHRLELTA